jgi:mannose-6-phosphate isomerase-like protein (cupin superfamily)
MSHTKLNLRDVDDSATRYGLSGKQEARFARRDLGAEHTGISHLIIKPGRREAFAHRHREAEEIYVVLAGSGRVNLDNELVDLIELDAVRVAAGTTRQFEASRDGLELLIFDNHVEGDVEQVPDFWAG